MPSKRVISVYRLECVRGAVACVRAVRPLSLSVQQGDSELGLKRALLVARRGCRFMLVLWLTSRWTYTAILSLALPLSLPGCAPHMGPCPNFTSWNIGKGFNFQIAAFSGKSMNPYFVKLPTSLHCHAGHFVIGKRNRAISAMSFGLLQIIWQSMQPPTFVFHYFFLTRWYHISFLEIIEKLEKLFRVLGFSCSSTTFVWTSCKKKKSYSKDIFCVMWTFKHGIKYLDLG